MDGRRRAIIPLPRLVRAAGPVAALWNAAGLLATALVGAGVVHLLAYHVPPGVPFNAHWGATALSLLAHCPLLGPLGLVIIIAVLAPLLALRELWHLERLNAMLGRHVAMLRPRGDAEAPTLSLFDAVPRSPWRLGCFVVTILALQAALFGLAGMLCPMQGAMVMDSVRMTMPVAPALPIGPLHLMVALGLALLLWRIERRLTRLRARVAGLLRLLARLRSDAGARPGLPHAIGLAHGWHGPALFARPPPLAA